jgi:hypothetical protein
MTITQLITPLQQFGGALPAFIQLPDGICLEPIAHAMQFLEIGGNIFARPPDGRPRMRIAASSCRLHHPASKRCYQSEPLLGTHVPAQFGSCM